MMFIKLLKRECCWFDGGGSACRDLNHQIIRVLMKSTSVRCNDANEAGKLHVAGWRIKMH